MTRFEKALRKKKKTRILLSGIPGAGKTMGALVIATGLVRAGMAKKILVLDTEHRSADLYSDKFDYFVGHIETTSIEELQKNLKDAQEDGFDVVIVDSLSHFWIGENGILRQVDNWCKVNKRSSFDAWGAIGNRLTREMIDCLLEYPGHVICTARQKKTYVESETKSGKRKMEKVGVEPLVREGIEFEFDVTAELNTEHDFIIEKTRCDVIDGKIFNKIKPDDLKILYDWLDSGEADVAPPADTHDIAQDSQNQPEPPSSETVSSTSPELAVDIPTDEDITNMAKEIIKEHKFSKAALLVWVPKDLEPQERFARLSRIRRELNRGKDKFNACARGCYQIQISEETMNGTLTGQKKKEVTEHEALFKACNLFRSKEKPEPLVEYLKEFLPA